MFNNTRGVNFISGFGGTIAFIVILGMATCHGIGDAQDTTDADGVLRTGEMSDVELAFANLGFIPGDLSKRAGDETIRFQIVAIHNNEALVIAESIQKVHDPIDWMNRARENQDARIVIREWALDSHWGIPVAVRTTVEGDEN